MTRMILRRDVDVPDGTPLPVFDFTSAESFAPALANLTLAGIGAESATSGSLQHRYGAIGVADDEVVHRRSQAFWKAVKTGDRATVAGLVQYPIFVQVDGRRTRLADPAALLAVYDKVFTPAFRDAIARGLPRNMFVRGEGAMLGDGQVWFGASGKVIALNN